VSEVSERHEATVAAPVVVAFVEALRQAEPEQWCSPPGLGTMRVRHVREALETGIVAVHHSGRGFAYVLPSDHDSQCKRRPCALCRWISRMTWEDHKDGKASLETRQRVLRQVAQLGRQLGPFDA
jgi:hypothetical protein